MLALDHLIGMGKDLMFFDIFGSYFSYIVLVNSFNGGEIVGRGEEDGY
jgi:hypothetical protein